MNIRVRGIHCEKRRIKHTQMKGKQCNLFKQFSYDLEMKTREQNRNNKRVETAIWLVQTRVAFGWLSEHSGEKNFIPKNFLEINRYFALMSYCNTIGQSNYAFSILGFLWRENEETMFWSFHPLADKTNNEHLQRSRSYENHSIWKVHARAAQKRRRVSELRRLFARLVSLAHWWIACSQAGETFEYPSAVNKLSDEFSVLL